MLSAFSYHHYICDYIKKSVLVLKRYLRLITLLLFFYSSTLWWGCLHKHCECKHENFKYKDVAHLFFFIRTSKFSLSLNILFFSDLSLNIFLKYSYFSRSALLLTVSEKSHTRKKLHFKQQNKTFFLENKKIILLT